MSYGARGFLSVALTVHEDYDRGDQLLLELLEQLTAAAERLADQYRADPDVRSVVVVSSPAAW